MRFEPDDFPDAVLDALAARLASRLRDALAPAATEGESPFVTRAEATRMGVEKRVLLRAERSGDLVAFRPGKATLYRRVDIVGLIERSRVSAPEREEGGQVLPMDPFQRAVARAEQRRKVTR